MSSNAIGSNHRSAALLAQDLSRAPSLSSDERRRAMLVEFFAEERPNLSTEQGRVQAFAEVSECITWAKSGLTEPRGAVQVLEDLRSDIAQMASLPDLSGVQLESAYVDKRRVDLPSDNPRVVAQKLGRQLEPQVRSALEARAKTFTARPLPIQLYGLEMEAGGNGRLGIRNHQLNEPGGGIIDVPFGVADASNPERLAERACEAFAGRFPAYTTPVAPSLDFTNPRSFEVQATGQMLSIKGPDGVSRTVELPFEPQRSTLFGSSVTHNEAGKPATLVAAGITRNDNGSPQATFAVIDPRDGRIASVQHFPISPGVYQVRGYGMVDGSPAEVQREVPVRIQFSLNRNTNPGESSAPFMDVSIAPDLSGVGDLVSPKAGRGERGEMRVERLLMPPLS